MLAKQTKQALLHNSTVAIICPSKYLHLCNKRIHWPIFGIRVLYPNNSFPLTSTHFHIKISSIYSKASCQKLIFKWKWTLPEHLCYCLCQNVTQRCFKLWSLTNKQGYLHLFGQPLITEHQTCQICVKKNLLGVYSIACIRTVKLKVMILAGKQTSFWYVSLYTHLMC